MPNWYWLILHFFHTLALGLWIGGIVAIGALGAPSVFANAASRHEGGLIMATILQRFDRLVLACIVALIATSIAMIVWYRRMSPWYAIEYIAIGMMSTSAIYSFLVVSPRIRRLRAAGRTHERDFEELHRTSVLCTQFNLACGALALFFS